MILKMPQFLIETVREMAEKTGSDSINPEINPESFIKSLTLVGIVGLLLKSLYEPEKALDLSWNCPEAATNKGSNSSLIKLTISDFVANCPETDLNIGSISSPIKLPISDFKANCPDVAANLGSSSVEIELLINWSISFLL